MRALKCDICGKFFDPKENAEKWVLGGDEIIDRLALLHSDEGGHQVVKVVDVCYECLDSMFNAANYRARMLANKAEEKNGDEI